MFARIGKHMELSTFSLVGAPGGRDWLGTEKSGELREELLSSLSCESGGPVVRRGLRGGGDRATLSFTIPAVLCPWWEGLREERRKGDEPQPLKGRALAEPCKGWSSLQMTLRPERSGPGPPSQPSSWRR